MGKVSKVPAADRPGFNQAVVDKSTTPKAMGAAVTPKVAAIVARTTTK